MKLVKATVIHVFGYLLEFGAVLETISPLFIYWVQDRLIIFFKKIERVNTDTVSLKFNFQRELLIVLAVQEKKWDSSLFIRLPYAANQFCQGPWRTNRDYDIFNNIDISIFHNKWPVLNTIRPNPLDAKYIWDLFLVQVTWELD